MKFQSIFNKNGTLDSDYYYNKDTKFEFKRIYDIFGNIKKTIKVVPTNKTVYVTSRQSSLYDELENFCNEAELDYMPPSIVFDGMDSGCTPLYNEAKAICDPKDIWDKKTGIDVAFAKADMKEHLRKARKLERCLVVMNSLMRKLEDVCQKHQQKAKAIKRDLENYYGGIYE